MRRGCGVPIGEVCLGGCQVAIPFERRQHGTHKVVAAAGAAAAGAVAMYLLDPVRGRRRRAMTRDKALHYAHEATHAATITGRDVANRWAGMRARGRGLLKTDSAKLEQRVRVE